MIESAYWGAIRCSIIVLRFEGLSVGKDLRTELGVRMGCSRVEQIMADGLCFLDKVTSRE